jgi:hypothetical protein
MADFIPIHVTKDGSDTDGLREFSSSDDIQVTNNLNFKGTNRPEINFSNENGDNKLKIYTNRQYSASAWQNIMYLNVDNSDGSDRTALKLWGDGDVEISQSGNGVLKVWNVVQLGRLNSATSSHSNRSVVDFLGGAFWFGSDVNKLIYYDGTSNQTVASEAYVTANAGGGGGVTPEILMFL